MPLMDSLPLLLCFFGVYRVTGSLTGLEVTDAWEAGCSTAVFAASACENRDSITPESKIGNSEDPSLGPDIRRKFEGTDEMFSYGWDEVRGAGGAAVPPVEPLCAGTRASESKSGNSNDVLPPSCSSLFELLGSEDMGAGTGGAERNFKIWSQYHRASYHSLYLKLSPAENHSLPSPAVFELVPTTDVSTAP
jgi:hypothetical protein